MKVSGSGSAGPVAGGAARSASAAASSFAPLGGTEAAAAPARTASSGGVASLGALLALQETGGPLERRRRAVGRAGRLLDLLDGIRITHLEGGAPASALEALRRATADARDRVEDEGLAGVLDMIDVRAAVELAKSEVARAA